MSKFGKELLAQQKEILSKLQKDNPLRSNIEQKISVLENEGYEITERSNSVTHEIITTYTPVWVGKNGTFPTNINYWTGLEEGQKQVIKKDDTSRFEDTILKEYTILDYNVKIICAIDTYNLSERCVYLKVEKNNNVIFYHLANCSFSFLYKKGIKGIRKIKKDIEGIILETIENEVLKENDNKQYGDIYDYAFIQLNAICKKHYTTTTTTDADTNATDADTNATCINNNNIKEIKVFLDKILINNKNVTVKLPNNLINKELKINNKKFNIFGLTHTILNYSETEDINKNNLELWQGQQRYSTLKSNSNFTIQFNPILNQIKITNATNPTNKLYPVKLQTIDKAGLMGERYRNKARLMEYDLESIFDNDVYNTLTKRINNYYKKADIIQEALSNIHGQNKAEWKYIEVLKQAEIELQLNI